MPRFRFFPPAVLLRTRRRFLTEAGEKIRPGGCRGLERTPPTPTGRRGWGVWVVAGELQSKGRIQSQVTAPGLYRCDWCEREPAHSLTRAKKCHEVVRHSGGSDSGALRPQEFQVGPGVSTCPCLGMFSKSPEVLFPRQDPSAKSLDLQNSR